MEEETYEVLRLPIGPYRTKLYRAMATPQIRTRYEELGLETTPDPDLVDKKTEVGYLLEGRLVIFQVIDELELLKELDPDALATNKLTVERKTIISLQELLFRMDPDILAIVLQQQLDEVLFISEGMSRKKTYDEASKKAYDEASKLISSEDKARIKEALEAQLIAPKPIVKELPPGKRVIHRVIPSLKERPKRLMGAKRKSKHPGKEKLKELIEKHQVTLSKLAKDLKVSEATVSRWINQDPELKQLAEDQRKVRARRKPKHPGKQKLKELIEKHQVNNSKIADDLRVSKETVSSWINKDPELKQLAEDQRKARAKRKSKHPGKEKLKELIEKHEARISEIARDLKVSGNTVLRWINQDLEFKKLAEEQRKARAKRKSKHPGKEKLKELIEKHEARISEIARDLKVSGNTVSRWINQDLEFKKLAEEQRKARATRATRARRKSKHPGKEKLKELIEKHQANNSKIADDLRVDNSTISRWINEDPELKQLAEDQRKARARRKFKYPGKEKIKELIEKHQANISKIADDLRVSEATVSRWINQDPELKKLAEDQRRVRAEEIKKKKRRLKKYPGDEAFKKLIVKYQGNLRKIANDSSVRVESGTIGTWINDNLELRRLASEQRKRRKSRKSKGRVPSNPGKEVLEALIFNYKGDLEAMATHPNINTDVETLWSWIKEEGLESLVG